MAAQSRRCKSIALRVEEKDVISRKSDADDFQLLADSSATLTYAPVWLAENDNPALRRLLRLARKTAKKG